MNFYYYGKTPSKGYDIASGCLLIIGIGGVVLFFSAIDSLEDLDGHYLELFFITLMAITTIFGLFRKKAKLHTNRIVIKKGFLSVNKINIPLEKINLDIYISKNQFMRYHLWDNNGIFSIFSVAEDDLLDYFKDTYKKNTNYFEEIDSKHDGSSISVKSNQRNFSYNLDVGNFSIKENDSETINFTPQMFIYDPKYKQGKPLTKK